jgi:hypothetical protein
VSPKWKTCQPGASSWQLAFAGFRRLISDLRPRSTRRQLKARKLLSGDDALHLKGEWKAEPIHCIELKFHNRIAAYAAVYDCAQKIPAK